MKTPYDVIKKPVISEKSMMKMQNEKTYVFEVAVDTNKTEVKAACESIFGVKVEKVNTLRTQGKLRRQGRLPEGRTPETKKAVVRLTPDSKPIEFFEGMV